MIVKNKKNKLIRKMSIVSVALVALYMFACKSVQKSVDVDKIYFGNVDEYPLFNGKPAEEEFRKYVGRNFSPIVEATKKGIAGRVFVEFIVEKDGSVCNLKIVGGADPLIEAEALRVISASPKWTPGKIDGKAVRMSYTLPINYRGSGEKNLTSTSKKAKLSKKSILLEEIDILVFGG